MPTRNEEFWTHQRYAFVGHSKKKGFTRLSFGALRKLAGKTVFAVDPSVAEVDGEKTFSDLASLPERVDAVVLEVPKDETEGWVRQAAEAGVSRVWIHMGRDTPQALALAAEKGIEVHTGTCAVMYLRQGPSYHSIHKWLMKGFRKY